MEVFVTKRNEVGAVRVVDYPVGSVSIYDSVRGEYRATIYDIDGKLHLIANEEVVLVPVEECNCE